MFRVTLQPERASYEVDLAGKIQGDDIKVCSSDRLFSVLKAPLQAEAVVNDPKPPRLFIMSRDGTAEELLRADDVLELESEIKRLEQRSNELPPKLALMPHGRAQAETAHRDRPHT
jgi:hypothetical protein